MASLTEQEKEQVRYHLGYMETTFGGSHGAAGIQLGIPKPAQTVFLLEEAITNLLTNQYAVDRVRGILSTLESLEKRMISAACQLGVAKLGDIELRGAEPGQTHTDLLEREYVRWAKRLSDVLGVPIYPYAKRFQQGRSRNVPVA